MRSLTRVSVLMGPPMLSSSRNPSSVGALPSKTTEALLTAGPKADQDRHRVPVTGPQHRYGQWWELGLHLLSLAYAGTVAHASLAGMTELPASAQSTAEPSVRDLAEIPAADLRCLPRHLNALRYHFSHSGLLSPLGLGDKFRRGKPFSAPVGATVSAVSEFFTSRT